AAKSARNFGALRRSHNCNDVLQLTQSFRTRQVSRAKLCAASHRVTPKLGALGRQPSTSLVAVRACSNHHSEQGLLFASTVCYGSATGSGPWRPERDPAQSDAGGTPCVGLHDQAPRPPGAALSQPVGSSGSGQPHSSGLELVMAPRFFGCRLPNGRRARRGQPSKTYFLEDIRPRRHTSGARNPTEGSLMYYSPVRRNAWFVIAFAAVAGPLLAMWAPRASG